MAATTASAAAGTSTSTHTGTSTDAVPYTSATCAITGTASALPRRTPSSAPADAGSSACATYARPTWSGVNPRALRIPIRRVPAATAPLTTVPITRTDMARPRKAKTVRKGMNAAVFCWATWRTSRYDRAPVTAPPGTAAAIASCPARTSSAVPDAVSR